jgi:hypothetical protein
MDRHRDGKWSDRDRDRDGRRWSDRDRDGKKRDRDRDDRRTGLDRADVSAGIHGQLGRDNARERQAP